LTVHELEDVYFHAAPFRRRDSDNHRTSNEE
jgi:hypothetical protein